MRINIDDTDYGYDLAYYYQGELFTGEVVETNRAGQILELMTLVDGRQHGPDRSWFPNGQLQREAMFKDGYPVGTSRAWHENGQLARERVFDDRGRAVEERRWNEDGSPAPVERRAVDFARRGKPK